MNDNFSISNSRKVRKGYNDFLTLHPDISEEWDYEANSVRPDEVTQYSNKKAFWICKECGNKYSMAISYRTKFGKGCPECSVKRFRKLMLEEKK